MQKNWIEKEALILVPFVTLFSILASFNRFNPLDFVLIVLQGIYISIFAIAAHKYDCGFRLKKISGETLVIMLTASIVFISLYFCQPLNLNLAEQLAICLFAIFSGLLVAVCFPQDNYNINTKQNYFHFLILSQFLLTILFGVLTIFPGGWVFWV